MQYLGGKAKWGKQIVDFIESNRSPGSIFVDVFSGALNVTRHVSGVRVALDACLPLVVMWQSLQRGWMPPDNVSEEQYKAIRANPNPNDPITAFAMFGCSYGGKWGGGYARSKGKVGAWKGPGVCQYPDGKNFAAMAKKACLSKSLDCKDVLFACMDYRDIPDPPPGTVLYCDPPYECTTGYDAVPAFDSREFWAWAERMHARGAQVFVSEGEGANPPIGWVIAAEWDKEARLARERSGVRRSERLYWHA